MNEKHKEFFNKLVELLGGYEAYIDTRYESDSVEFTFGDKTTYEDELIDEYIKSVRIHNVGRLKFKD